jgi:hypothetical protein
VYNYFPFNPFIFKGISSYIIHGIAACINASLQRVALNFLQQEKEKLIFISLADELVMHNKSIVVFS